MKGKHTMSFFDGYKREERSRLTPGDYRVAITDVEETTSRNGNPMLVVTVQPNGSEIHIKHYLVKNEYFNRNLTDLLDSFGLGENFDTLTWVGAVGAAKLVEDENGYLKVRYFLSPERAEKLPPWQGKEPERQEVSSLGDGFEELDKDDLPFN